MVASTNQYISFLSHTYSGTVQDMKIAKLEASQYPENIRVFKDLGYKSYSPKNAIAMEPIKKLPKKELTKLQKWYNQSIAQIRVSIEHAIAGIKRCRIIKERCRVLYTRRDRFLLAATGLHNLRVFSSLRKYTFRLNTKYT